MRHPNERSIVPKPLTPALSALLVALLPGVAAAQEGTLDSGDTAWMLVSTAFVIMMTAPALALFYGGLVRRANVLSILMQCLTCMGVLTLVWILIGYTLAFGPDHWGLIGGLDHMGLAGIGRFRRTHEVQRISDLFRPLVDLHLLATLPLGLGRRLAGRSG